MAKTSQNKDLVGKYHSTTPAVHAQRGQQLPYPAAFLFGCSRATLLVEGSARGGSGGMVMRSQLCT